MIKLNIVDLIRRVPGSGHAIDAWHFYVTKRDRDDVTKNIERRLRSHHVFVVQIGSNDGKTGDPIYPIFRKRRCWGGLFVEPIPYLMEKLQRNYSFSSGCKFECAVVNDGQPATLYYLDPQVTVDNPELPGWYEQLGSLNPDHASGVPGINGMLSVYRKERAVNGITFEKLLEKHQVSDFDLLHIDAEGFDWKILSQVDLVKYKPKIILFEHKCLAPEEKEQACDFVRPYYALRELGGDMFCVRKKGA